MNRNLACLASLILLLTAAPANAQDLDWSQLTGPMDGLSVQKTLDHCATTPMPATVACTFNVVITANTTAAWGPISIGDASSAWITNVILTHGGMSQNCQEQHANPSVYDSNAQIQVVTYAMGCSLPAMALNQGDTLSFTVSGNIDLQQGHPYDEGDFSNCIGISAENVSSNDGALDWSCVRFTPEVPPVRPTRCLDAPDGMVFWSQFDSAISPSYLPNPPSTSPHPVNANRQLVASDLTDLSGILHPGRFLRLSGSQSRVQYVRPISGTNPFGLGTQDFSIDAWVRIPPPNAATPAHGHFLIDMRSVPAASIPNRGVALHVAPNGSLTFQMAQNAAIPSQQLSWTTINSIADGDWHHIAVTVDRDQANGGIIWIDGSPASLASGGVAFNATPYQSTTLGSGQTMVIGFDRLNQAVSDGFDIDEIEIFHRALDMYEIRRLVVAPKCR
jgi:hypothetical protein